MRRLNTDFQAMSNTKKWFLYLIYITAVTAIFLYYLFPSDTVKEYISFNLKNANPDFAISIDTIRPVFPPAIRLRAVSFYYAKGALFDAEQVTVAPKLLSLFRQKKIFSFKGSLNEGNFEGNIEISKNKPVPQTKIDARLSGIRISDIPGIQNMSDRKLSGRLDGKIVYENKGTTGTANAELTISDGIVELLTPIFTLESITFRSLEADVTINKQKLRINKCTIKGQQMDGNILGSVRLKDPLGTSILNLRGTIKPQRAFLADLRKSFPVNLLPKKLLAKNGFPITLKGTIEKPSFSLQ